MNEDHATVYLVVYERGGLSGAYLDEDAAHRAAQLDEGGVVVALPAAADYRAGKNGETALCKRPLMSGHACVRPLGHAGAHQQQKLPRLP